jgi:NADH dehydrogenase
MATLRLVRAAERAGVKRFVFFSAINAHHHSRTRFFRAKALAEEAVEESSISSLIFRPSIIYTPGDPWLTLLDRLSRLPAVPVSGSGRALYQPVWADDVADAVMAALSNGANSSYELAGPEVLSYNEIVRAVLRAEHRRRRLLHVPLPVVRASLRVLPIATWEEVELLEEPMVTERGTADIEQLGVHPHSMPVVLGV